MKTSLKLAALFSTLALAGVTSAHAQTLFLTANTTKIRTSTNGGTSWSDWVTGGTNFRGIAVDGSTGRVFVNDVGANTATNRPLYAYNSSGTQLASTTYDTTGGFNQHPVAFFNGYAYVNAGLAGGVSGQCYGSSSFNGSSFASVPLTSAGGGNWQGNDLRVVSDAGTDYLFANGTGGSGLRRYVMGAGTLASSTAITVTGTSANNVDLAFTANGRLLVIDSAGIWLSGTSQVTTTTITVTQAVTFSASENTGTGDMGASARDLLLLGNDIYAVTDQNIYHYTVNDAAGTISFVGANAHGFNSNSVQIAGYTAVPEPSTYAAGAGALALAAAAFMRRRRK